MPTASQLMSRLPEAIKDLQKSLIFFREYSASGLNKPKFHRLVRFWYCPIYTTRGSVMFESMSTMLLRMRNLLQSRSHYCKEHCAFGGMQFGAISMHTAESSEGQHKKTKQAHRR